MTGDGGPGGQGRRGARERALSLLYEAEQRSTPPAELLAGLDADPEPYAVELVSGVDRLLTGIDGLIEGASANWALARMPAIDRNLLRMATFELLERDDVPTAVILDEAVELAKGYSTEASGSFVNGVLARLASEIRSEADAEDA